MPDDAATITVLDDDEAPENTLAAMASEAALPHVAAVLSNHTIQFPSGRLDALLGGSGAGRQSGGSSGSSDGLLVQGATLTDFLKRQLLSARTASGQGFTGGDLTGEDDNIRLGWDLKLGEELSAEYEASMQRSQQQDLEHRFQLRYRRRF